MEFESVYFDLLPRELIAFIQFYVEHESLDSWCTIIKYCENKVYWEYFYSLFIKDWKLIIDRGPEDLTFLEQYKELLNLNLSDEGILAYSASQERMDEMVYLVNKGIYIDEPDRFRNTALMYASTNQMGDLEPVEYLVENGADVDIQNSGGDTPLILASSAGYSEIIEYLLDRGADINHQDVYGDTALINASVNEYLDVIELLVNRGAKVNIRNERGNTALMTASMEGHLEIVEYLESLNK